MTERYNIIIAIVNPRGVTIGWPLPPVESGDDEAVTASGAAGAECGTMVDPKGGKAVRNGTRVGMRQLQITIDDKQASKLCKDLNVDVLVPIH